MQGGATGTGSGAEKITFDKPSKVLDNTGALDLAGLLRLDRGEDPARFDLLKYVVPVWERAGAVSAALPVIRRIWPFHAIPNATSNPI